MELTIQVNNKYCLTDTRGVTVSYEMYDTGEFDPNLASDLDEDMSFEEDYSSEYGCHFSKKPIEKFVDIHLDKDEIIIETMDMLSDYIWDISYFMEEKSHVIFRLVSLEGEEDIYAHLYNEDCEGYSRAYSLCEKYFSTESNILFEGLK